MLDTKLYCSMYPDTCVNDGKCLDTNDGLFYCECEEGFTGITCGSSKFIHMKSIIKFCITNNIMYSI